MSISLTANSTTESAITTNGAESVVIDATKIKFNLPIVNSASAPYLSGTVPITNGGTGATTAATALTALGGTTTGSAVFKATNSAAAAVALGNQYGVIRQATNGAGWFFITDSGHQQSGFTDSITISSGNIVVPFSSTASKVGTFVANCDETYSALGIALGASVGLSSATLSLYKTLDVEVNLTAATVAPSTYFVGDVSAVNNGDGTVTITHPSVGSATTMPSVDPKANYLVTISGVTATTTTIKSLVPFSGTVSYDGANWVVSTPALAKPTFSFSAGVLTVTHETFIAAESAVQVVARDSSNTLASVGTIGTTSFTVVFRDYAGALITTETTNMRFVYSGSQLVTRETPIGNVLLSRPNCKLDAAKVYSGSGNIWLIGTQNV